MTVPILWVSTHEELYGLHKGAFHVSVSIAVVTMAVLRSEWNN